MDYTGLHQHESHDGKARLSRRSWWSRGSTWTLLQRQSRSIFDEEEKQNHTLLPTAGRFSRRWIAEALKNAKEDVKTAQWKIILWPICCHLFALSAVVGILAGLLVLATGTVFNLNSACMPDGAFGAGYESYNIWSISGIFQITLGFGELPFSTVKIIDVLWDVCVGRGGQAVLAYLSYQVFTKALMRSMEHAPVSYGTFEAITLQHGSSTALMKLAQGFTFNKGLRAKVVIGWIIISAIFVLAFPTLTSAMSGYTANGEAYININNNFVIFSNFVLVRYIIHDGWRVGLGGNFLVTTVMNPSFSESSDMGPVLRLAPDDIDDCLDLGPSPNGNGSFDWSSVSHGCELQWRVSQYVSEYGFLGMHNTSSVFNRGPRTYHLDGPTLNISGFYTPPGPNVSPSYSSTSPWYTFPYASNWINPVTRSHPYQNVSNVAYTYADASNPNPNVNETYNLSYIQDNGSCQPSKTYKWGFSYPLLFIVILSSSIWAIGTYTLWLDAYYNSRIDYTKRSMSMQRAVLEISTAMKKDMGEDATENVSDQELKQMLQRGLHGNKIGYDMLDKRLPVTRGAEMTLWWRDFDLIAWAHHERWWIAAWCFSLSLAIVSGFYFLWILFPAVFLWLGINVAIAAGRDIRSRWLSIVFFPVLGLLLIPALLVPSEQQAERQGYFERQKPNVPESLIDTCIWTDMRAVTIQDALYVQGGFWETSGTGVSLGLGGDIYSLNFSQKFSTTNTNFSAIFDAHPPKGQSYIYYSGTMFANNDTLWTYGGEFSGIAPAVPANSVPIYQSYPTFSVQGIETLGSVSNYISSGAGVNIPSESLGYYFSGMTAPNGVQTVYDGTLGEIPSIMAESLIRIDTSDSQNPTWSHLTLPAYIPGRAGAQLVWLPVSSKGVLLAIGGLTSLIDAALGLNVTTENEGASPNFMTQIPVFDIGSNTWFVQNTSGEPPSQRMEFCSVVANEHGSSGFQIYIHGGFDGTMTGNSQGDVWVLSVPSFTWTQVYANSNGDITHHRDSHTCVSPYPDRMLVIGGQNSANVSGLSCTNGIIDVFNITSLTWLDEYDPSVWSNYMIPSRVASIIGPSPTANMSPELVAIFQHKYEKSIPTYYPYAVLPASLPTHKATHLATMLGSGLGMLGLLVLLLAIWCFRSQSSRQSRLTKKQSSLTCVQDWVRGSPRADEHITATKFGVSEVEGGAIHQPQVLPTTGLEGEVRQTMERGSPDTPVEIPTAYYLRDQPLYSGVTSQNIPPRASSPNVDAIDRVPALDYPGHDRVGNLGSESNSIAQLTPSAEPVRLEDQESSQPSLASSSSKRKVYDSGLSSESALLLNRQPTPPSQEAETAAETEPLVSHQTLKVPETTRSRRAIKRKQLAGRTAFKEDLTSTPH